MNNPINLVKALLILIETSLSPGGPSLDVAFELTADLEVSKEWVEALIFGWEDYAKRYKRPLFKELSKSGPVRFLTVRMLRKIKFTESERCCRLCGCEVQPPRRKWHKECWEAFEPFTNQYWREICKMAFKRANKLCELCGDKLFISKFGHYRKKSYQFDHICPVALGGQSLLENVQVLCIGCHREKTKLDMIEIRKHKKQLLI